LAWALLHGRTWVDAPSYMEHVVVGGRSYILHPPLSAILSALEARKMVVSPAPYEKRVDDTSVEITFQARIPADAGEELVQILESQPGLRRVRVDVPS